MIMENHEYKLIIFDFDGVIVQTEQYNTQMLILVLKKYGIKFTKEQLSQTMGLNHETRIPTFNKLFGNQKNYQKNKESILQRNYKTRFNTTLINIETPGLEQFLSYCRKESIVCCVCTNSSAERTIKALQELSIFQYFECVYSGNDLGHSKPDPYIYNLAMKEAGMDRNQTMIIEDSQIGIHGAKASGAFVVALKDEMGYCLQDEADIIVNSFNEVAQILSVK